MCSVYYDDTAARGPNVRILDAAAGHLGVRYAESDVILPLRVETTGRGTVQLQLVMDYLRKLLR